MAESVGAVLGLRFAVGSCIGFVLTPPPVLGRALRMRLRSVFMAALRGVGGWLNGIWNDGALSGADEKGTERLSPPLSLGALGLLADAVDRSVEPYFRKVVERDRKPFDGFGRPLAIA